MVIGDTHCPGMHQGYVDFLQRVEDSHDVTRVVHIGDADRECFDLISPIGLRRLAETNAEGAALLVLDLGVKLWRTKRTGVEGCAGYRNYCWIDADGFSLSGVPFWYTPRHVPEDENQERGHGK